MRGVGPETLDSVGTPVTTGPRPLGKGVDKYWARCGQVLGNPPLARCGPETLDVLDVGTSHIHLPRF